ncbi:MAG: hypothetical protein ACOC7U_04250 [Spirochaetota bacterium]
MNSPAWSITRWLLGAFLLTCFLAGLGFTLLISLRELVLIIVSLPVLSWVIKTIYYNRDTRKGKYPGEYITKKYYIKDDKE